MPCAIVISNGGHLLTLFTLWRPEYFPLSLVLYTGVLEHLPFFPPPPPPAFSDVAAPCSRRTISERDRLIGLDFEPFLAPTFSSILYLGH